MCWNSFKKSCWHSNFTEFNCCFSFRTVYEGFLCFVKSWKILLYIVWWYNEFSLPVAFQTYALQQSFSFMTGYCVPNITVQHCKFLKPLVSSVLLLDISMTFCDTKIHEHVRNKSTYSQVTRETMVFETVAFSFRSWE